MNLILSRGVARFMRRCVGGGLRENGLMQLLRGGIFGQIGGSSCLLHRRLDLWAIVDR